MVSTEQQYRYSTFGIDSKFGVFFFRYPWRTAFILILIIEVLIIFIDSNFENVIRSGILLSFVFLFNLIIAFLFTKNHCYKILIDNDQDSIKFFKFFNRGVKTESLNDVRIIVHKTCDLVFSSNIYTVFPGLLHEIVPYLPRDTKVEFSGFFGRIKKKDWERRNINITPGT